MAETQDYHVELRFLRDYEFVATFPDVAGAPAMVLDEPPSLGNGTGPNAASVLAAAIGNCLAVSFAFCLRKVRLEPVDLTASVVAHVGRNEQGRLRVQGVDVTLVPTVRDDDRMRLECCQRLFEDFCTVTESVRRGLPVTVTLARP